MTETTRQITEYNQTAAILDELAKRYANVVFPVTTKDGMKDAKDVRSKLVKLRTGLEAVRKEIKEPALRRTQAIDAEAKAITAAIRQIEEPIDAQIKAEEQRIEAEKAAKEAAEKARVDEIQTKIEAIKRLPMEIAYETSEAIQTEVDALYAFAPDAADFAEFVDLAVIARGEALTALVQLHSKVQAREQVAIELDAERAELAKIKAALQAERDAIAAERAALDAVKEEVTAVAVEDAAIAEPLMLVEEVEEVAVVPVSASDWTTRRIALATATQFAAMADKVEACGVIDFANQLRAVAFGLREGDHDAQIARADKDALIEADTALMDATANSIDALTPQQVAA